MSSITITLKLDSQLGQELEAIARDSGRSTDELVTQAVEDWLDDREDERQIRAVLERNEPASSSEDVRKRLGLER